MRKIASLLVLTVALGLGGCASTGPYGNFVQADGLNQQQLAADAVQQFAKLYAPAHTNLELQQPTPDPFGQALVKSLREKGYSLLEYTPDSAASKAAQADNAKAEAGALRLPLRYVLDQAGDSNLYRLTLLVGNQSITRPYLAQNGTFAPAGFWSRKE